MICLKGFTTGLITGAVVGSVMGMFIDPLKDCNAKKIKKSAGNIIHSVGNIVDTMTEDKH